MKNSEEKKETRKDILLEAFNTGNLEKVKTILKKCHSRLDISKLCDLFYNAYKTSFLDICSHLLEVNQNNICSRILEYACENNNMELAKILLDAGADANWRYRKDVNMCIQIDVDGPLHYAVERNNIELVQLLLDRGADVNIFGWCFKNVIESACENKNIEMVKLLIEHGADIYYRGHLLRSALHHACSRKHYNNLDPELDSKTILDFLEYIMSFGFDVDIRDEWENTPLHYAFDNKEINMSIVEYLISKGADINAVDNKGETIFYKSRSREKQDYLISLGADINIANNKGDTAFLKAAHYCHLDSLKYLAENGADVHAIKGNGSNALHQAVGYGGGNMKTAQYLVSLNIDINARDNDGETVLHWFCGYYGPDEDVFNYLLDQGIDVNIQDDKGRTVAHKIISRYGHRRTTKLLLDCLVSHGADLSLKDNNGDTAYNVGEYQDYEDDYAFCYDD